MTNLKAKAGRPTQQASPFNGLLVPGPEALLGNLSGACSLLASIGFANLAKTAQSAKPFELLILNPVQSAMTITGSNRSVYASPRPTQLNANHEKGDKVVLQAVIVPSGH